VAAYAAPKSYQQHDVLTAPPGRLVVLLYDGAIRFLRQAAVLTRQADVQRANTALQRGEAIIAELLSTLDYERGGEIATNLRDLYLFCQRELNAARIERDADRIDVVVELLLELRDAWAQVDPGSQAA
jgi:flagellar secretion chaperone FliS